MRLVLEGRARTPDRAPAEALRRRLEVARDAGVEFELAWAREFEVTIAELRGSRFEREAWAEALSTTVDAWHLAYDHAGAGWRLWLELLEGARERRRASSYYRQ